MENKSALESQNALVSAITILLGVVFSLLRENGLILPAGSAEQVVDAIGTLDLVTIVSVVVPSILLPVFKFVKNGFPNFVLTFKTSSNFRTQLAVAIVGLLGLAGVVLQVAGINNFLNELASVTTLSAATVISLLAALLHAINSAFHIAKR